MGNKSKDTIPREEKRMQKLNFFDPQTNINMLMLEESAYQNSFILSLSSPPVILFKSIESMLTATSMNLNMKKIANEVVVNYKTLVTKKIHCF